MKTNFIIIWALILSLTGAFALKGMAQERDKCPSVVNSDTLLLADETTLTYSKTEAVIVCDNQTIFNKLHETHSQLFKRFTCTWKFDGRRYYKHYVLYIDKGDADIIKKWARVNL